MKRIRIFTKRGCPYSRRAKELLDSYGAGYEEIDITGSPTAKKLMETESRGGTTTPQVIADGRPLGGADSLEEMERRGILGLVLGEDQAPPQFI